MIKFFKRLTFIVKIRKFIPFLKDFFLSTEVKGTKKAFGIMMIVGYLLFPFDIIPDFLSLFGIVDDIVIASFILERIIKIAPASLKEKYNIPE